MRAPLALLVLVLVACRATAPDPAPPATVTVIAPFAASSSAVPASQAPVERPKPELGYPWRGPDAEPTSSLLDRFEPPSGFTRVALPPKSFGAWLRTLPLEPPGTPVLSFQGRVVLPPDHENLAAVVSIDVGDRDLQQCADSILRLHAEWLFAAGRRDASYRAASGAPMPFARWARGERMMASPNEAPGRHGFTWTLSARPDASHASYRRWLDAVFTWANTGSLARDGEPVAEGELGPGDFVVQPGGPGHAVLVLDVARASDGRRALLLGQGFMPAQSFHVLRPSRRTAWFVVEPGAPALDTPFWAPFPWKALRRLAST